MIGTAKVIVYCDLKENGRPCQSWEEFELHWKRNGWSENTLDGDIRKAGWIIVDENFHICPACQEEAEIV